MDNTKTALDYFIDDVEASQAQPNYSEQAEVLRKAWASDEARRNRAIGLWVAESKGYPVPRPVSADEFKGATS